MLVVIPALTRECPAVKALELEGVKHDVVLMEDDYSYSELMMALWNNGDSFMILEHDVVPWPGAIEKLAQCSLSWCGHHYPFAPNCIRGAMGNVKFSRQLIAQCPNIYKLWETVKWNQIDGAVFPGIIEATGLKWFHRHSPDFAHVKGIV